jgi:hypothetical protein
MSFLATNKKEGHDVVLEEEIQGGHAVVVLWRGGATDLLLVLLLMKASTRATTKRPTSQQDVDGMIRLFSLTCLCLQRLDVTVA